MHISAQALGLQVYGSSGNDELIVRCPFPEHDDRQPSASFNTRKGILYCFGCGQSATANSLADILGGYVQIQPKQDETKRLDEKLWLKLLINPLALNNDYLLKRRIKNDQIKEFKILANSQSIVFPLEKNGSVVGVQIRQFTRNPKYLTFGEKIPLWPLQQQYDTSKTVVVCESVFSALRLMQFDYQGYATLGAMIKPEVKDYLRNFDKVMGIFDDDKAGYLAAGRLLKLVPHAKVLIRGIDIADLLDKSKFLEYTGSQRVTSDLNVVANAYGHKKDFFNRIAKVS